MLKDGLDHFLVFDEADDPHGPLSFRADQGIYFVYLLNQPGPTFPEGLFVSLRFEDAGDGITNFQGSVNIATLDMDATLIASGKQSALYYYQGYRAYQPQNTWWAEQGIVLHTEFRDGNVPAGFEQLRVLKQALGCLPEGIERVRLRSDTAGYQHDLLRYCATGESSRFGVIEFAIGCDVTPAFKKAAVEVEKSQWLPIYKVVIGKERAAGVERAEVCFVPNAIGRSKKGPAYRYLAKREALVEQRNFPTDLLYQIVIIITDY